MLHWILREFPSSMFRCTKVSCEPDGWESCPPQRTSDLLTSTQCMAPDSASISQWFWGVFLVFGFLAFFFFLPYLLPLRSCNICISCSYSLNAWAIWNSHNIGNSQFSFLKYCDSLSAFQRHVCWGTNGALPVNPICDKDFPRCTHSMVPVLLCAWLASFWSAFVLLFHLRKDTLVTNQSSAC